MRRDPADPVDVQVTIRIDRAAIAELAAALMPLITTQVHRELLAGLTEAARWRPDPNGLSNPLTAQAPQS